MAYSSPARTYFRDGYWTLQPLLTLAPEAVRDQIRLLAKGVQPDGEAPSGVILSGPAQSAAWRAFIRASRPLQGASPPARGLVERPFRQPAVLRPGARRLCARRPATPTRRHGTGRSVTAIIERYFRLAGPDGLPLKPRNDRDWADNVFREGLVAYDLGLWVGALDVVARARRDARSGARRRGPRRRPPRRAQTIDRLLWVEARQGYADYATPDGFVEDHLTLDSLTLARYDAVPERQGARGCSTPIAGARSSRATTASSPMATGACSAPIRRSSGSRDIRAKTAFAFRYHNGSDWPYLDGLYAEERLRRGLGGARYALTRWWAYCLAKGWAGPVEYYAPPFGRGSLLQGWSAMPAPRRLLQYRAAVLAEGSGRGSTTTGELANDGDTQASRIRARRSGAASCAALVTAASVGWAQAQTLVTWDDYTDVGQNAVIEQLNKNFMAAHPGVTIDRTARTFDDLSMTLKLTVAAGNGPQVTKVNQGAADQGTMVKQKLLLPIDDYVKQYGWDKRLRDSVLARMRWSDSGQFGEGTTYGISGLGEMVGLYYNQKVLPTPASPRRPRPSRNWSKDADALKAKGVHAVRHRHGQASTSRSTC